MIFFSFEVPRRGAKAVVFALRTITNVPGQHEKIDRNPRFKVIL
jgi:hypothetical protein